MTNETNKGYPVNFDVSTLKKGDEFADGFRKYDLKFIKFDDDFVYAKHNGKTLKLNKVSIQINGYALPVEKTGEFAIGVPMLEERRTVSLTLKKTKYKDIPADSLYLLFRNDRRLTNLYIIEPFSEYSLDSYEREDIEKTGGENVFLYIVDDKDFVQKENERQSQLQYENTKSKLFEVVDSTNIAHKKAVNEMAEFLKPKFDKMIEERDLDGLNALVSELPDCWYSLRVYRAIDMIENAIKNEL